jgi:hypothetical protein
VVSIYQTTRYDYEGKKIVLVIDGNPDGVIISIGL